MELKVGFVCDRGLNPKRPVNQDRFLAIAERGLFAVFDGVGGQRAGEVASQTAAETIEEALAHTSADSSTELIRRAIKFANRDIFEMAESDPAYKTMATTVAVIHISGDRATIAHVGDSRVYRLEDGRFYRETIDHTDFNDDLRAGLITADQAAGQTDRNVINRALGIEPEVEVEVKVIKVRDGARFLLCSDGIYRHLSDEEIARIIAENKDPQAAADQLKRVVHERGAEDNLTAVVVQIGRARQGQVLAVDSAGVGVAARAADGVAATGGHGRGGRIQVEFNRGARREADDVMARGVSRSDWQSRPDPGWAGGGESRSVGRKIMWMLVALVAVAGAFYGGLRASDWMAEPPPNPAAGGVSDQLRAGRELFDRGDSTAAETAFASILAREPQSPEAHYWLGRAQLEQGKFTQAGASFEAAIRLQPRMFDSYVQAAAAYEAAGDKARADAMLRRYADERRKQIVPAAAGNSNGAGR